MSNSPQTITITGNSMFPTLVDGERLKVQPNHPPENGDICLIRDKLSNELIVHRLVSQEPMTYKGDNSLNLETGNLFILIGVCLEKRRRINKAIAYLSLNYRFESSLVKRVISKTLIRLLSF